MQHASITLVTHYTTMAGSSLPGPPSVPPATWIISRQKQTTTSKHNLTTKGMIITIVATIAGNNANNINGKVVRMIGRHG